MVGQLGRSKNSRSQLKLILCCSLPKVIPHIKFYLNWMKNKDFQILEILDPQIFFENSAEARLSKLEPFAWSHWIRSWSELGGVTGSQKSADSGSLSKMEKDNLRGKKSTSRAY